MDLATPEISNRISDGEGRQYGLGRPRTLGARDGSQSSLEIGDARSGHSPEAATEADLGAAAGEWRRASC
ncbi:hypothetical protein EVAR_35513_1 [Eumeta japonica]|uniref:Uncharacterized protein n=1 Tax=Eumeta variegata TaxID=151549 RepID=A0A4C1X8S1_EUMVA|nr:hypothetical protein EVAR_35513_1 [Eumeta japonica]